MKTLQWNNWSIGITVLIFCFFTSKTVHAQAPPDWFFPTNISSWSFEDTSNWTSDLGYPPISFSNITNSLQGDIGDGFSVLIDSPNAAWLQYNVVETNSVT